MALRLWIAGCLLIAGQVAAFAEQTILNVSYEPTRRFYSAINQAFAARWQSEHGERVSIYQSHGGSGKQARSVAFGLGYQRVIRLSFGAELVLLSR